MSSLAPSTSVIPSAFQLSLVGFKPSSSTDATKFVKKSTAKARHRNEVEQASLVFEQSVKQILWQITRPELNKVSAATVNFHLFSELAKPLLDISGSARLNFLCELVQSVMKEQRQITKHFIESEFFKILRYTTKADRLELIKYILGTYNGRPAVDLTYRVLNESRSVKELKAIVEELKDYGLETKKNSKLRELLAAAELQPRLVYRAKKKLPKKVSSNATKLVIRKRLPEVTKWLNSVLELCEQSQFADTQMARDYRNAFKHAHRIVAKLQNTKDVKVMREQYNALVAKLKLEAELGICLMSEKNNKGRYEFLWTPVIVNDIAKIYHKLSDLRILTTPRFYEIKLLQKIEGDDDSYGQVDSDGNTALVHSALEGAISWAKQIGLKRSMQVLAAHELGHSVQVADQAKILVISKHGEVEGAHWSRYDFKRYLDLNGWSLIRTGFKLKNDNTIVNINGKELQLNQEVILNGSQVMISYKSDQKILYIRKCSTQAPIGTYWQNDPWEDWAEAFSQYVCAPRLFHHFAPDRFRYFEDQFGLYAHVPRFSDFINNSINLVFEENTAKLEIALGLFENSGLLGQTQLLADLYRKVNKELKAKNRYEISTTLAKELTSEQLSQNFYALLINNPQLLSDQLFELLESCAKKHNADLRKVPDVSTLTEEHFSYYI